MIFVLVSVLTIGYITQFYTRTGTTPVKHIVNQSLTGSATNIIAGLGLGMKSTALPIIVLGVVILVAYEFAGLYGIAMAAVGMLSTCGITIAIDAYGPITDNAGGYLMQQGKVDIVIVGTDRTTATGDVANKIGTYLKALAARDNHIPFYVALPSTTFDWNLKDGIQEIPIEERDPDEIRYIEGLANDKSVRVLICPENSPAANYAFDVTPAKLVTGFITERGICKATPADIQRLFPEKFGQP